jgi:hypothetical protein
MYLLYPRAFHMSTMSHLGALTNVGYTKFRIGNCTFIGRLITDAKFREIIFVRAGEAIV